MLLTVSQRPPTRSVSQDEFISMRWLFSICELLVVLVFLGHLCGCFFYMCVCWTRQSMLIIGKRLTGAVLWFYRHPHYLVLVIPKGLTAIVGT
jgi:isoprenylcysteine carboxyl methyltransferase (ICMT) family protein YpbQ